MKSHNFIIGPTDTDSISFCKPDGKPFSEQEQEALLNELNSIMPEKIVYEGDGYFPTCIAVRAKNYMLWDGKEKKIKGSAFKTSSKEPAMKEMMEEFLDSLIETDDIKPLIEIYHKYVREAINVKDIRRWCQKKTVTASVLKCKGWTPADIESKALRKNECDVWDAIQRNGMKVFDGDKIYVYPVILEKQIISGRLSEKTGKALKDQIKEITGLRLAEDFQNDQDVDKFIGRVISTVKIFKSVIDIEQFTDYTKAKNKHLLEKL